MDTTVTGIFSNQQVATLAAATLVRAGFRPDQVRVVHASTPDRHDFIGKKASDTKRAVLLGALFGAAGGALAGAALGGAFGLVRASVVGGLAVAAGGALLGLWIGRATTGQIQDELENQVLAGTVLVSVTTDSDSKLSALDLLAKEGGTSIVSTAASFTAGVVPTVPSSVGQKRTPRPTP